MRALTTLLLLPLFLTVAAAQTALGQVEKRSLQKQQPVARLIVSVKGSNVAPSARTELPANNSLELASNSLESPTLGSIAFDDAVETERRAFNVTNEARLKNGLTALTWDPLLCRMAREHSEKMARRGFFSHHTPEGFGLKERARAAGVQHFKVLGENIAYNEGFEDPGAFAVERWLTSSQHRANILSREFSASAVGTYVGADGRIYFTQVFILR